MLTILENESIIYMWKNHVTNLFLICTLYKNGYVTTLFNRKRKIEELNNTNYIIRSQGERIALNTPVQGTAADIIKIINKLSLDKEMVTSAQYVQDNSQEDKQKDNKRTEKSQKVEKNEK